MKEESGDYMHYSIGEIAEKMNVTIHTLRYYDQQGLLPFLQRDDKGRRLFSNRDIILLNTIECMKTTGMSLKDIKQYVDWCVEGFASVPQRYDLLLSQKEVVEKEIAEMQKRLDAITYKCEYYKEALETGTTELCEEDRSSWADKIIAQSKQ